MPPSREAADAAAVAQVASAIEELLASVRQHADHAVRTQAFSAMACEQADRSSELLRRAVAAMDEIHASSSRAGERGSGLAVVSGP